MNTEDIELPPLPKASKMYDIPGYDEEELKDYARAAITAALPFLTVRWAVKKLKWKYVERTSMTYVTFDDRGMLYYINQSFGSDSYYFATFRYSDGKVLYDGDDLPSAKAAAQADYERRILAALETAEPATDGKRKWPDFIYDSEYWPNSRPPESRLREALEHVTELLVDTWNTKMEGDPERQVAVRDARAALKEANDERAGFVVLSRSEVDAIRDKALEEAAEIARKHRPSWLSPNTAHLRQKADSIAAAIRALKSGGDK